MKTHRFFQVTAVILVGIAAYFLWLGNTDGVFVSLVLSGCAYFLNMRFQIKESLKSRAAAENQESADTEKDEQISD